MLFRDKKSRLYVGFELGDTISQISYMRSDKTEPETVSLVPGQEIYGIPTILCKRFEVNQWFFGSDVAKHTGEGVEIDRLLSKAYDKETIELDGEEFEAERLLALFVKRGLSLISMNPSEQVDYLMITTYIMDARMIEVMNVVADYLGMDKEHIFFGSYSESFYEYVMHQQEALRSHEILLLDSREQCKSYSMSFNRRCEPVVAFIEEKSLDSEIFAEIKGDSPSYEERAAELDSLLSEELDTLLEDHFFSSVYLVGERFTGKIYRDSMRKLCTNRRGFQGNNLFCKGACYGAMEKGEKTELSKKYLFLGKDKIKANVGILAEIKGREEYYPLLDAGKNWYEIDVKEELILGNEAAIKFVITPLNGRDAKHLQMVLEDFPKRPEKASRIELSLKCDDESHMRFTVIDLGFGELFRATDYRLEDVIEI